MCLIHPPSRSTTRLQISSRRLRSLTTIIYGHLGSLHESSSPKNDALYKSTHDSHLSFIASSAFVKYSLAHLLQQRSGFTKKCFPPIDTPPPSLHIPCIQILCFSSNSFNGLPQLLQNIYITLFFVPMLVCCLRCNLLQMLQIFLCNLHIYNTSQT